MSRAQVFPREARTILTRTGGYLSGFTHSLQPYTGCEFSCLYCYASQMTVQHTNPHGLPWSRWLAPKLNAPDLLARAADRGVLESARIFCSSTTDPYTPNEKRFEITRRCLEVMTRHPPAALVVQTRSPLVERDLDLIARIPTAGVSVTVTTVDEKVRRALEPDSPSSARRLETLGRLRAAGIPVQAAVAPMLPGDVAALARALDPVVDRVVVDDYFVGDGAGGRRSGAALRRLESLGHGAWAVPGYADKGLATLRRMLGAERVVFSKTGFNDLSWLGGTRTRGGSSPP